MIRSERIFLTGFMGSGKSTHGKKLASSIGYSFVDLDSYIEKKENASVQQIFEKSGEQVFREKESEYLNELLSRSKAVISLGGGTVCFHNNVQKVLNSGLLIYIKMPALALYKRLINSYKERPLLKEKTQEQVLDFIQQKLQEREKFYSLAPLTVNGVDLTTTVLKEEIIHYEESHV